MALDLAELGFTTALYRDSDEALTEDQITRLAAVNIPVFEYGDGLNSEQAIFGAAKDHHVQELLDYARAERGDGAIDDNLLTKLPELKRDTIQADFSIWEQRCDKNAIELRIAIAEVAVGDPKKRKKAWFKDMRIARGLAPIVWSIALEDPASPLAKTLKEAEDWLYG
jgi:hypothetical protein